MASLKPSFASTLIRQWRLISERRSAIVSTDARSYFGRYSMDHIPDDLLELQARFDQWRANRKYNREPVPDQLRDAALEMSRRYPSSLLRQVLKIQLCRLMPKAKTNARRSKRQQPQTAFFKLQPPAPLPQAAPSTSRTSTDCRLQLERPDGARLSLTLPSFDAAALHALCADFLRGSSR
jgi:hypothetical protein